MQPIDYLRTIRRRWPILLGLALVGAILGAASAGTDSTPVEPTETYWEAHHAVVAELDGSRRGGADRLAQYALFATTGDVPRRVAQDLGLEAAELGPRIRTITNTDIGSIDIAVVALDPAEATQTVDAIATALIDLVEADDAAEYEEELADAREEVDRLRLNLDGLDARIAEFQASGEVGEQPAAAPAAPVDPNKPGDATAGGGGDAADTPTELRDLQLEREAIFARFTDSLAALDELDQAGPPPQVLTSLDDDAAPIQITEREYGDRIRNGELGQRSLLVRDVTPPERQRTLGKTTESPLLRGALGGTGGLLLGVVIVMGFARLDPRLNNRREAETAFGLPVLVELPRFARKERQLSALRTLVQPSSVHAERFRVLRSALMWGRNGTDLRLRQVTDASGTAADRSGGQVVLVTSAHDGEGKTTTTANLAVVLAEAGYRVLVVNADFRNPSLHVIFDTAFTSIDEQPTGSPRVNVLADLVDGSTTTPWEIVQRQREVVEEARARYDLILVDGAALLATNDPVDLLPVVDVVLVVANSARTTAADADAVREVVERHQMPVAGVVLVGSGGVGKRQRRELTERPAANAGPGGTEPVIDLTSARPSGPPAGEQPNAPEHITVS